MDRIWQWTWDRHGARYRWAIMAVAFPMALQPTLAWSLFVVAVERSEHYVEAAAVTVGVLLAENCVIALGDRRRFRPVEQWAAGLHVDRATALEATYTYARRGVPRALWAVVVSFAVLFAVVAAIAGASGSRLVQYAMLGAAVGSATLLVGAHGILEGAMRPARVAIGGDTGIGDALPRSRPTFAAWSSVAVLGTVFAYTVGGAMAAAVFGRAGAGPALFLVIGCVWTVWLGLPQTVGFAFAPALRPFRELAAATQRVAAGDYGQRVPVVQDDDLGALAASFNRMQAGLAERQRLQVAFGTYVDPALAARLLSQGDDVFTGERREVTVLFIDIRDFTSFAEANTAEDTVTRLNALFDIVVPAVVDAGGHVNKFLGDGALAVFGAPNDLADHADAAMAAAVRIHRLVAKSFDGTLRIGIGINTGLVIAGTIGSGGKLEFTLIGDTVNVAARVEQLTKTTGDAILLTGQTVDALASRPPGLTDRGCHAVKGKSAAVPIFGLNPGAAS